MCVAYKEAWQKVKGVKRSLWGAIILLMLIAFVGSSIIGLFFLLTHVIANIDFAQLLQLNNSVFLNPKFVASAEITISAILYYIVYAVFDMFLLLPMRMGIRLIPLRRVVDKEIHTSFMFKFLSWKYIWRFMWLIACIGLMVGIPAVLGCIIFCLPHTLHLTFMTQLILCYAAGIALLLLALYLTVSYIFASYAIIDRDISAWQAMELSRKAISKRWFYIFGTLIWLGIALIIGAILLLIGLIWAVPYTQNVLAILYRDMIGIAGKDPVTLTLITHTDAF